MVHVLTNQKRVLYPRPPFCVWQQIPAFRMVPNHDGLFRMPNTHFTIAIHALSLLPMQGRTVSSQEIVISANMYPAFVRRIIRELVRDSLLKRS
ncbi:MAG: hypothetical protein GC179_05225 [Anaerolineaceae bacterium]|nr:hypothetical protein [Anaerolineaceae bacterium]